MEKLYDVNLEEIQITANLCPEYDMYDMINIYSKSDYYTEICRDYECVY